MNRIRQHLTLATRDRKKAPTLAAAVQDWQAHRPARCWTGTPPTGPPNLATLGPRTAAACCVGGDVPDALVDEVAAAGGGRGGRVPVDVDPVEPDRGDHAADSPRTGWQFTEHRATPSRSGTGSSRRPSSSRSRSPRGELADRARTRSATSDGASQFAPPAVFTSTAVLAAEDMLLALAEDRSGPAVDPGRARNASLRSRCPAAGLRRCPWRIRRRPRSRS